MKYKTSALIIAALMLWMGTSSASGQCTSSNLTPLANLEKTSLVIDVRPDQVNQFRGKYSFKDQAHIALINMNPFLFSYRIKVDQTEIQDTGFLNFLNLLGAPVSDLIGSARAARLSKSLSATTQGNLQLLINRTNLVNVVLSPNANCDAASATEAQRAITELDSVRTSVLAKKATVEADLTVKKALYVPARAQFNAQKNTIFNSSVEAQALCSSANTLLIGLNANPYPSLDDTVNAMGVVTVKGMRTIKQSIADFRSLINELTSSAQNYLDEYENCPARANGLSYADNLKRLASELDKLGAAYETLVNNLIDETKGYDALKETISKLETTLPSGMIVNRTLQREYTVLGKYEISALDITVTPEPLGTDSGLPIRQDQNDPRFPVTGDIQNARRSDASTQGSVRIINAGASDNDNSIMVFAPHRTRASAAEEKDAGNGAGGGGGGDAGGPKQIKAKGTIGDRRFEISGGMVFSSLGRREFQSVLGYARNEQGQIVDDKGVPTNERKLSSIVGMSEETGRRFAPIAMLHYRLPFARNVFASVGFTGKRDDYGTDLEYVIGPSFLFKNLFFTVGGYAGKQQTLAGDLFVGAKLDGSDVPVRKEYKWGLGFGFTYKIPLGTKKPE